jgi:hypothetical protein
MKEFDRCLRCGKKLKKLEHRLLGYGPSCYKKMNNVRLKKKSLIGVEHYDSTTTTISSK